MPQVLPSSCASAATAAPATTPGMVVVKAVPSAAVAVTPSKDYDTTCNSVDDRDHFHHRRHQHHQYGGQHEEEEEQEEPIQAHTKRASADLGTTTSPTTTTVTSSSSTNREAPGSAEKQDTTEAVPARYTPILPRLPSPAAMDMCATTGVLPPVLLRRMQDGPPPGARALQAVRPAPSQNDDNDRLSSVLSASAASTLLQRSFAPTRTRRCKNPPPPPHRSRSRKTGKAANADKGVAPTIKNSQRLPRKKRPADDSNSSTTQGTRKRAKRAAKPSDKKPSAKRAAKRVLKSHSPRPPPSTQPSSFQGFDRWQENVLAMHRLRCTFVDGKGCRLPQRKVSTWCRKKMRTKDESIVPMSAADMVEKSILQLVEDQVFIQLRPNKTMVFMEEQGRARELRQWIEQERETYRTWDPFPLGTPHEYAEPPDLDEAARAHLRRAQYMLFERNFRFNLLKSLDVDLEMDRSDLAGGASEPKTNGTAAKAPQDVEYRGAPHPILDDGALTGTICYEDCTAIEAL
jgi:hypothetical protein